LGVVVTEAEAVPALVAVLRPESGLELELELENVEHCAELP
jgi:hypothetical protein